MVLDLFVAQQHVSIQLCIVIEVVGGVRIELHAFLAVLQGAIAGGGHRAAVLGIAKARARLQACRATETSCHIGAVGGVKELVAGERAVHQPIAAGQRR